MSRQTNPIRLWGGLLVAGLPFLLIMAWWLRDSPAYVRTTTPEAGVPIFWPASQATLNLRVGCPPNGRLPVWGPCWDDAAEDAAAQWNAVGADFRFRVRSPSRQAAVACTSSAVDGLVTVIWADMDCGMAFGDDTLAVTHFWFRSTGELVDSDVRFNTAYSWSTYAGPQRPGVVDFHRVAIHEFGHVLGLSHPDEHGQRVTAIMNSKSDNNDRLRADDIAGIKAIYGGESSRRPDPDYCVGRSCGVGEGDCDPGQCATGLVCSNDVGAKYGLPAHYDVCEAGSRRPDPDYCVGRSCGVGEGDCDPGQCAAGLVCSNDVGAKYGLPAHYDVCEAGRRPDPDYCVGRSCGVGEGDCDPGQCATGLVCSNDVGAKYGLPAHYDVCEAGGRRPDPNYCVNNYCGIGDGDCEPGQCNEGVCVNDVGAKYGLPAHYDVCEAGGRRPDPNYCVNNYCGIGDGDCEPGQCNEGVCVRDIGAQYGLPASYDVCEAGGSVNSLKDSLGTWEFSTFSSIDGSFGYTRTYWLGSIDTSKGYPRIVGTRLNSIGSGGRVVFARSQDILDPGHTIPYDFILIHEGLYNVCSIYAFDKIGANRVEGLEERVLCRDGRFSVTFNLLSPLITGTRTSRSTSSVQEQLTPQAAAPEQLNAAPQRLEETITLDISGSNEADSAAIRDIIDALSPALD